MNIWEEKIMAPMVEQYLLDGSYKEEIFTAVTNLASHIRNNSQFKGNYNMGDSIQDAIERVFNKIHLWDVNKGRAYSYIYRIIYISYLGDIRERKRVGVHKSGLDYMDCIDYSAPVEEAPFEWEEMFVLLDSIIERELKKKFKSNGYCTKLHKCRKQLSILKRRVVYKENILKGTETLFSFMRDNKEEIYQQIIVKN